MMAFATTNPATLRRWAISAVAVVLVHGAIVAAVVTWRKATVPAGPLGPVVIELVPMPAAPTTEHAALPPAPDKTQEKVEQKLEAKTAARAEEKAEPGQFEESPRVTAPLTLAPPEGLEGANRAGTKAVPGGETGGAMQAGGGVNPIDTRIGEQPRLRFKKAEKANDWTKAIMGRPSKSFAGRQQPRGPGTTSGMARNAIGMLVQGPAGAMGTKGLNAADTATNAVGVIPMHTFGGSGVSAVNGTATNAIGVGVATRTRAAGTNIGQPGISRVASRAATLPDATINGTGMARPGSGTVVLGGPAKNVAGLIDGTGMRPRLP